MFWREAISSLHVLVGVRCSGGIASPDCYQARNDAMGLFARNDAPFRHCEERSDEAISPIAPPRHCEPKGLQVFWREAISSLHVLVGVRCSEGIASPDCYQARNDEKEVFARDDGVGLQARNDECCVRNDAPFCHCEFLPSRHCEERSDEAISPIAPLRHCEPKGWQVCWREAISSLHLAFLFTKTLYLPDAKFLSPRV